jgi:hypothetical protein
VDELVWVAFVLLGAAAFSRVSPREPRGRAEVASAAEHA